MNKDEILQYASYLLWATLLIVITLIINRKMKQRAVEKKAQLHPMVHLYSYELQVASESINFFFDADDVMEFCFFITNFDTKETLIITESTCRKGGQKIHFDTTKVPNGVYFFGIETQYQRIEKRIVIQN